MCMVFNMKEAYNIEIEKIPKLTKDFGGNPRFGRNDIWWSRMRFSIISKFRHRIYSSFLMPR